MDEQQENAQQYTLNRVLLQAAATGDCNQIETLIELGADVNRRDRFVVRHLHYHSVDAGPTPLFSVRNYSNFYTTPLMRACLCRQPAALMVLLKHGAHADYRCTNGWTALHWLCRETRVGDGTTLLPMAKMLVHYGGADLNAVDDFGNTPLHYSCRYALVALSKWLVEQGAAVNVQNTQTPLHDACHNGEDLETIQLLLEAGADILATTKTNQTCVDWALERHHTALAQRFDNSANLVRACCAEQQEGNEKDEDEATTTTDTIKYLCMQDYIFVHVHIPNTNKNVFDFVCSLQISPAIVALVHKRADEKLLKNSRHIHTIPNKNEQASLPNDDTTVAIPHWHAGVLKFLGGCQDIHVVL